MIYTNSMPAFLVYLGFVAAGAIPAAAFLAWSGFHETPASPKPPVLIFVEPGLLVAHLAMAVPLGCLIASRIADRLPGLPVWAWAGTGIATFVAAFASGRAGLPSSAGAGFLACALFRSASATGLVVPWLMAFAGRARRPGRPRVRLEAMAAIVLAVLPPLALAHRVARSRASDFASHRETGRLALAWAAIEAQRELGIGEVAESGPIAIARRALAGELRRLARVARATPGPLASSDERLAHAFALIGLGRADEAEAGLRAFAATDPDAALLLASVERDQGRWVDAERDFLRVIGSQIAFAEHNPGSLERCSSAYDGLADARLGGGRPAEAGSALRQAIATLPSRAGHFTLRLGQYELDAGRPRAALALIDRARRLDPSLAREAAPLIHAIRVRTPACLLAR